MNVLNVTDLERELRKTAARALHPNVERWLQTVPRNYLINKPTEKDTLTNFRIIVTEPTTDPGCYFIPAHQLPPWAAAAVASHELVWFDTVQLRRREFWTLLDIILFWFNSWKSEDTRLRRIDRISFPVATKGAVLWYKDVSANIWNYIADKPSLVATYEHGFHWVRLVTQIQFEREGKLMNHCVGNGSYYNQWRQQGAAEFYSLRDRHNQPHCTMQVRVEGGHPLIRKGYVSQCKGNSNRKPDKIYQPYIRRFITEMHWQIEGDHSHID